MSVARLNLKEAGGKHLTRGTRTQFEAVSAGQVSGTRQNPKPPKAVAVNLGGYMSGKMTFLSGEASGYAK